MTLRSLPLLLPLVLAACAGTPDGVLSSEQLASLLCDLQLAEAYTGVEGLPGADKRAGYQDNDSAARVMRQSVMMRHGVSEQQFEATLDWYGHHLDRYDAVCERTLALLDQRKNNIKAPSATDAPGSPGNLWKAGQALRLSGNTGRTEVAFTVPGKRVKKGDRLEWSFNTTALTSPMTVEMAVDYTDGTTSVATHRVTSEGHQRLALQLDSTLVPRIVYGRLTTPQHTMMLLDSIAVTTTPLSASQYYSIYGQRTLK